MNHTVLSPSQKRWLSTIAKTAKSNAETAKSNAEQALRNQQRRPNHIAAVKELREIKELRKLEMKEADLTKELHDIKVCIKAWKERNRSDT